MEKRIGWILGAIVISVQCILLYNYFAKYIKEKFKDKDVMYASDDHMLNIVNISPFFKKMTEYDLIARNTYSISSYKEQYYDSLEKFSKEEKAVLETLTTEIDTIPTANLKKIPWKFAKVSQHIENGYPHTLEDTIILTSSFFNRSKDYIKTTLIHEKIHVYQRVYNDHIKRLISDLGFKQLANDEYLNILPKNIQELKRNNPDVTGTYVYNYLIPIQLYTSKTPSNLADSSLYLYDIRNRKLLKDNQYLPSYISQSEHPFEVTAVIIPIVLQNKAKKDDFFYNVTKKWCARYL